MSANTKPKSRQWTWTEKRPNKVGWYWFRANEDSPKAIARDEEFVVCVGCDEDANVYGVKFGNTPFPVDELGGYFAGPLTAPSDL